MPVIAMEIKTAEQHPNADALRVYRMEAPGHESAQVIANLETVYEVGQRAAVALVGTVLADGTEIKKAKLRGVLSFGMALGRVEEEAGTDLSERFGATDAGSGAEAAGQEGVVEESRWPRYTSISSYLKFRDEVLALESVVVTEKIHGSNFRFGFHEAEEFLVGTHTSRVLKGREDPEGWPKGHLIEKMLRWVQEAGVRERVARYRQRHPEVRSLAVYGELHGAKCADLHYGMEGSKVRLFGEVNRDGAWLDHAEALQVVGELFPEAAVEELLVPVLYEGKPDHELFRRLRDQPSRLADLHGAAQASEGVVIKASRERFSEAIGDRLIVKYKSPLYEERKSLRSADPSALPRYVTAFDVLQDFVTEERLRHVLGKAAASGLEVGPRHRDTIARMLLEDIVKEAKGEWPADADLSPGILLSMTKKLSAEMLHEVLKERTEGRHAG